MPFHCQFLPLATSEFAYGDGFWTERRNLIRDVSLEQQYGKIAETGRLENFYRVARGERGTHQGRYYDDSDVYKWLEACAYVLADRPEAPIRKRYEEVRDAVVAAQMEDGYINTFFQLMHPDDRWRSLVDLHEMYCAGHLIEAAVAAHDCIGDEKLLQAGIRLADHIAGIFGPDKRLGYCGHQEIELALVRLANHTGNESYRELARWMVEVRGRGPAIFKEQLETDEIRNLAPYRRGRPKSETEYEPEYWQVHAPIREHTSVVGHAVRGMYFYAAATDLAASDDEGLFDALDRCWRNLTERRMYVTGGIGPSARNEGFTHDFDLPNLTAYAETCAAVALAMWGRRLAERTGDSSYADVVERAIHNGALAGIALTGDLYFYDNPLESRGKKARVPWFECACCPPNIARLIGSIASYGYSKDASAANPTLVVNMPIAGEVGVVGLPKIRVTSEYPYSGRFQLEFLTGGPMTLRVRIPEWCGEAGFETTGFDAEADYEDGYAVWSRDWREGDAVEAQFEMMPRWVRADPRVLDDLGRVALAKGPLIFALEEPDFGVEPQRFAADTTAEVAEGEPHEELGRVPTLLVPGWKTLDTESGELYLADEPLPKEEVRARFIPYFAWNNRGAKSMQIWVRESEGP